MEKFCGGFNSKAADKGAGGRVHLAHSDSAIRRVREFVLGVYRSLPHLQVAGCICNVDPHYYICNSKYVSASCDGVGAIQADDIEDIVFDEMSRKLKEFNELSYTEKQGDTAELTKLKIRLEEIEKEIATLIDKIVSASEATMEYINKRVDALDEEKKKLREKVSQLSAEMYDRKNIGVISGYMNNWENVSMDDKLSVVDALIETIRVGHGKVQISWKI